MHVKQDRKVFPCQRLLNKHKICTKDRTETWKLWQQISTFSRHTENIRTQNTDCAMPKNDFQSNDGLWVSGEFVLITLDQLEPSQRGQTNYRIKRLLAA